MKTIRKISLLLACLAGACLISSQANAASIGVQFSGDDNDPDNWLVPSDAAGVVVQSNWNVINIVGAGDDPAAAQGISNILLDSNGIPTAVQFRYHGNDGWRTDGPIVTPNDKLMKGTLRQSDTATMTLTFTNLSAGSYDVYVYGDDINGPSDLSVNIGTVTNYWQEPNLFDGTFAEAASTDPNNRAVGNYVHFTGVSPVSGAITVSATFLNDGTGDGIGIAGLQLVSTTSFPPWPNPPTVTGVSTQVQSVAVYNGSEASFSFAATNNAIPTVAFSYQWYKNGQVATNVTGNYFTFLAGPRDTNAQVYCVATLPAAFNPNNLPPLTSATGTVTVLPGVIYTNGLKVEFFSGASRQDVEAGNVGPATSISLVSSFEMPVNVADGYTRRISGYFIPPTSGNYVFFVCSDDNSDLFVSTNSDPANKRLIAQENNWSDSREWTFSSGGSTLSQKRSDQWSPDGGATIPYSLGIPLLQGQLYYLEGVQNEGNGGDNFAATYKLIADPDPLDDDAPLLQATNRNIALITSPTTNLVWVTQPVNVTNEVLKTITLTARATSDSEMQVQYQWYKTNSPVPGATGTNYSFPASLADNGTQWYVTASTVAGSITSAVITVTVKPASFPVGIITFEDQDPNPPFYDSLDFQPNPYTEVQGLPAGVIATFTNWGSWQGDQDHTPPAGAGFLLYGDDTFGDPSITFNMPVGVPSFWVTTGPFGAVGSSLKAYLNGVEQFAFTNTVANTFAEVALGAGRLIDSIVFGNYGDCEIDDFTIVKPTSVITFSDQIGNDVPANPNPYTGTQGLWPGLTATFDQLNNWNGGPIADHTADTTDNYKLYGNNYTAGGVASITFNARVEVPSLWVTTTGGGQPGVAKVQGYLAGVQQFTHTLAAGGWAEVTAGAGLPIDTLRFIDYGDSWIDDITVRAVANPPVPPARLSLSRDGGGALILSWTGQGKLYESSAVTGGWGISANQANPQTLTVGPGSKFYRVVYP